MSRRAALAVLALALLFGRPFRARQTKLLLPVQSVQVEQREGGVYLLTEAGESTGADFCAAVTALRESAPGVVFLDTAQYLVLCGEAEGAQIASSGLLRPNVQVYRAQGCRDPEALRPWLAAHESGLTLAQLWEEENERSTP